MTGATIAVAGCTDSSPSDRETNDNDNDNDVDGTGGNDTGGGRGDTTDGGTSGSAEATVKLGEVVQGDSLKMVVRKIRTTKKLGQFSEAESGNTFLVVRMAVKNTSDGFIDFSGFWQARVKDATNHVYTASFTGTDHPLGSGVLASGEVARGDMVFEIPKSATDLTLQFDFSSFDLFEFDRVTVDLGEKAAQIGDVSQSLNVDVHSPGEMANHSGVGVTLHGVRTTTKVSNFAEAEEGNEFVITDIEITNNSSEPLSVSSLLQMSVKDGTGLTYGSSIIATSQLDQAYSEGSEIAAGESRRGEIAYEVAMDVDVAYWTFNFLDFDAKRKAFWKVKG